MNQNDTRSKRVGLALPLLAIILMSCTPAGGGRPVDPGGAPSAAASAASDAAPVASETTGAVAGAGAATSGATAPPAVPSAIPSPLPDAKVYWGEGVVTKIDPSNPSIELDHQAIPTAMPQAMRMEFYVTDPKLLDGLKVGDRVGFALLVEGPRERISDLRRK